MTTQSKPEQQIQYAGLFRRLFAIFYDWFLLLALLLTTTAIFTAFNGGLAIESNHILYIPQAFTLALITFFFFTWFWTHGGQTLGLKTWKCKLTNLSGGNLSWKQATFRFFLSFISISAGGLGFLWSLFHKERKTWHDLAANTQLLDVRDN